MRRQLEGELQENEAKYKTLFDSSSDALLLRRVDRTLVSGNRTAVVMFGCEDEEDLARHVVTDPYPEYQPDGVLSLEKAPLVVERALRDGSCRLRVEVSSEGWERVPGRRLVDQD